MTTAEDEAREAADLEQALAGFAILSSATAHPLGVGLLHKTYGVEDSGAHFILQRVNPIFSLRIHDNIVAVTGHLRVRGVETLQLEATRDGAPYLDLASRGIWRLMTRLPGTSFDRCPDVAHAREAGRRVSAFHGALADFTDPLHPLGFPFHDTAQHHANLDAALARHTNHPLHDAVARVAAGIAASDIRARTAPRVPARIIHGDLKFNNLLFDESERTGHDSAVPCASRLIDLDTLSRMPLCFDWGDAWRSWCNRSGEDECEAELDLDFFRAATEGLMETRSIAMDRAELDSLTWALELLSLETCARFATDALEQSYFAWDRDRFESAGDHNLVRARGQLSLYQQARDTHEERARFILG